MRSFSWGGNCFLGFLHVFLYVSVLIGHSKIDDLILMHALSFQIVECISIAMQASKLAVEDCLACVDLLEVLLVDHPHRFMFI